MTSDQLLIIDGNSLLNRYYYGTLPKGCRNKDEPPDCSQIEKDEEGHYCNAINPMMAAIYHLGETLQCPYTVACFDSGGPTIRSTIHSYKSGRSGTPEPLLQQLDRIKDIIREDGMAVVERPFIEGDDLIASLARKYRDKMQRIYVVSTDHDLLQLVDGEKIFSVLFVNSREKADEYQMFWPGKHLFGKYFIFDREMVKAIEGVYPEQIADLKALKGDRSDNIHGIYGVGRNAAPLISHFGSLNGLMEAARTLPEKTFRANLETIGVTEKVTDSILRERDRNQEMAQWLATPCCSIPVNISFQQLRRRNDTQQPH